ncbi:MAG: metalloregulator ArsR/SmtB family transcription factor [Peptococcaceae bacterium]|jgi:ArsR family transcriptional regulator|nr:metalloregulator ArsR/SmtB family transcription factor [Peptococcaceae bacterium]MDH7525049.1 metalloregulator ArsR/SmtB family transcription factor [Peptococcaceae bacterium]
MADKYSRAAERLKAVAEPTRLKIVEMLAAEEMCVCEIIDRLSLSQPAVSHHLKTLRQAGIISDRKEGKWVFYSLNKGEFCNLLQDLQAGISPDYPVAEKHEPTILCPLDSDAQNC